jgi:hypothetical protein
VAALDGDFRLTSKDNLRFQVLGTRTSYPDTLTSEHGQPDGEFDGLAYDLFYFHGTRSLDWYLAYRKIQDGVRLDLGYRPQVNYDYYEGGWGYTWNRSADHWYTMLNVGSGYEYEVEEGSGDLINKGFSGWFDYEGPMQSYFHAWGFLGTRRYEGLEFDNRFLSTEFGLRLSESLDAEVDLEGGRTVDYDNARQGTQITVEPQVEYRVGRHLKIDARHSIQRMTVGGDRLYTAQVSYLKGVYQFNRRMFLRAIFQYVQYDRNLHLYDQPDRYDAQRSTLLNQIIFYYKEKHQTMLFLGYSDAHDGDQNHDLTQIERTVFLKIGYALVL